MRGLAGGTGPDEDADSRRALLIFSLTSSLSQTVDSAGQGFGLLIR